MDRAKELQAEIQAVRDAIPGKVLKVIIESAALSDDAIVLACKAAAAAQADFVKTSTGFHPAGGASVHAVKLMRETVGDRLGVKASGGIRTAKDAIKYLVMVNEIAGEDWLDPDWFRFGASTLLNDLLMQRTKLTTGRYSGPDYFTLD